MKTDNITILKKRFADYDDWQYFVTKQDNIEDGLLHDTYGQYGQQLDEYAAGDYCLANFDCSMKADIEKELRAKFGINEDADLHIEDDGTITIDDEENEAMTQFARQYNDDNSIYTEAKYFTYWDGSNYKSIVVECDLYDNNLEWEVVDDEDLIAEIKDVIEQYDPYVENAEKSEEINGWEIGNSRWQSDPWMCYLRKGEKDD